MSKQKCVVLRNKPIWLQSSSSGNVGALNHMTDALKQRDDILGQKNEAMKWLTELLNRMADAEKRAKALENTLMHWNC
ncbi:hypothetical protein Tco_1401062 [Tanacetum coccineum]